MTSPADIRRREITRAFVRYFALSFLLVGLITGLVAYTIIDARSQRASSREIRMEYCTEIEKLKAQNRAEVAEDKKNFPRTLRLLKLEDTPEIRAVAQEGWDRALARNAPKPCPYGVNR